jgi:hypothetical protein
MVATTLSVIVFTVVLAGSTVRFLVSLFRLSVSADEEKLELKERFKLRLIYAMQQHALAGMEAILGGGVGNTTMHIWMDREVFSAVVFLKTNTIAGMAVYARANC